jgi:hypothetical protein
MKKIAEVISYLALVLLVAAPVLFYAEKITLENNKLMMLIATVLWFASALCWIGRHTETKQ